MDIIFERRSVRKYTEQKIAPEKIDRMLRAAMQAPSATNQQPWEFIVIDDKETIVKRHLINGESVAVIVPSHF